MALIKTSALVSDIRGKSGGNVFSRNKGGSYVRQYIKPTNPNTIKQQLIRSVFTFITNSWRLLTGVQRNGWTEAAPNFPYVNKLGETKVYTGQQLFVKLNQNLAALRQSLPLLINAPSSQSFPGIIIDVPLANVGSTTLNFVGVFDGDINLPPNFGLIVEATAPLSAGIDAPQVGRFKFLGTTANEAPTEDTNFFTPYVATFGDPAAGDVIFIRVKLVSQISGEMSSVVDAKLTWV